jgi:hypothetical protein
MALVLETLSLSGLVGTEFEGVVHRSFRFKRITIICNQSKIETSSFRNSSVCA